MVGIRTRRCFAGSAERLGVGHDVGLRHRDEIVCAEMAADLDLMFDRPLHRGPERAGPHRLFVVGQPHREYSICSGDRGMDVH